MNSRQNFLPISILMLVLGAVSYRAIRPYPVPHPAAQQQLSRCLAYFSKRPSLQHAKRFLAQEIIGFNTSTASDLLFAENLTTLQEKNRSRMGSTIVFRIHRIEYPRCGYTDEVVYLSFDKTGQFLAVEHQTSNHGCMDF